MARAVRFDQYGGLDVLQVVDVPDPVPGPGEVLVRVKAASINPGEAKIREGALHSLFPATFPSGEGSDFAGVVEAVGVDVTAVGIGDEVIGYSDNRNSQAELVVVAAEQLTPRPPSVPWEVAGSLHVAGVTAWAAVRAVSLSDDDTVVVAGAAGGVGVFAVQLAALTGATVIGLAGESKHGWLRSHDVVPVLYGDGVEDRIRAAAPGGVDAFLDLVGGGYVELALALGVAPERIDTIADFEAVSKHGVKGDGSAAGTGASTLAELAADVANGSLEVPIVATYPLERVRDAYAELEQGHTLGKIVLLP
jgi:NADPH:quinone reductase-like Zn-dependent oxidoreductase